MKLQILENEYWWGGIVHEGIRMPLGKEDSAVLDFRNRETPNQVTPLLLSSAGRYLWCEKPFTAVFALYGRTRRPNWEKAMKI